MKYRVKHHRFFCFLFNSNEIDYANLIGFSLQPLVKEHRDYAGIIDKVNDLGNAYDALTQGGRPESPARRRSGAYSPTKRLSSTASPSEFST